jgi:hypothetical protein
MSFLSRVIMMEWMTKKQTWYMYGRVKEMGHNRNKTSANFVLINYNFVLCLPLTLKINYLSISCKKHF